MIWDEIDGVGPAKPRVIGRWTYRLIHLGGFLLSLAIVFGAFKVALATWGAANLMRFQRVPFIVLANFLGSWVFRAIGRAIDSSLRQRGLLANAPSVAAWEAMGDESSDRRVVEVRARQDEVVIVGVFCLVACVPFLVLGFALATQGQGAMASYAAWARWVGGLTLVALLVAGFGFMGIRLVRKGAALSRCYRVDTAGITDVLKGQFVAWSDIACCRVTTYHDVVGDPAGSSHQLIGAQGAVLLTLELQRLTPGDRDRLLARIFEQLPRPIKDDRDGRDL